MSLGLNELNNDKSGGGGDDDYDQSLCNIWSPVVPFHKDFSSSGEQLEHRKLAHDL